MKQCIKCAKKRERKRKRWKKKKMKLNKQTERLWCENICWQNTKLCAYSDRDMCASERMKQKEREREWKNTKHTYTHTHTHNACIHVREACLKMRPFFVYKWRPIKKMSHENNAKILHFFSSSTSSSSSSSLYSFACNCVLKKCMVDLFNSRDWLSSSLRGSYSTTAPATSSISAIVYNHRVSVGTFSFSLSLPCT